MKVIPQKADKLGVSLYGDDRAKATSKAITKFIAITKPVVNECRHRARHEGKTKKAKRKQQEMHARVKRVKTKP